jgi:hypothetical protein
MKIFTVLWLFAAFLSAMFFGAFIHARSVEGSVLTGIAMFIFLLIAAAIQDDR